MDAYDLHKAFMAITAFCSNELSSLVFDLHKDTLYTLAARDPKRRSAQTALYEVLQTLLRLSAPVLVFTAEEAWSHLPAGMKGGVESIHFSAWPAARPEWRHPELEEELGMLVDLVRPNVSKRLEEARAAKQIGHPYDAASDPDSVRTARRSSEPAAEARRAPAPALHREPGVHYAMAAPQDGLHMAPEEVKVEASAHEKCPRCWRRPGDIAQEGGLCGRCAEALATA